MAMAGVQPGNVRASKVHTRLSPRPPRVCRTGVVVFLTHHAADAVHDAVAGLDVGQLHLRALYAAAVGARAALARALAEAALPLRRERGRHEREVALFKDHLLRACEVVGRGLVDAAVVEASGALGHARIGERRDLQAQKKHAHVQVSGA
eukprot:354169-Chlamydomonas_euryale.AAC.8